MFGLMALWGVHASAQTTLAGTLPISFDGLALNLPNGNFLSAGAEIDMSDALLHASSHGTGDYYAIPFSIRPPSFTYYDLPAGYMLNLSAPDDFTMHNSDFGSFGGVYTYNVVTQTANYFDVELYGYYTPGTDSSMVGKTTTSTELSLSFTLSQNSVSGSGTLNSPYIASGQSGPGGPGNVGNPFNPTPEPGAIAMAFSLGLTGLGLLTRRRTR